MLIYASLIIIIIIINKIWVKLDNEHCYDHVPKSVETSHEGKFATLWNEQVPTDRTVPNNKPHIIIRDNKRGMCVLIDVVIPEDRNVIKYKDFIIEIQGMWNVKANVIPAVIGATGNQLKITQTIPEQNSRKA